MPPERVRPATAGKAKLQRGRTTEIRGFILANVGGGSRRLANLAATRFGISSRAINRHLRDLVGEGILEAHGQTRARKYRLRVLDSLALELGILPTLAEDRVWTEHVAPHLREMRPNVFDVCHYGFTEMLNNVIDHSQSTTAGIRLKRTATSVQLGVIDFGVGIFRKIASDLGLEDERHAILELAKGKVTTDPDRHSGEGIFFTSRMFDYFGILSGKLSFSSFEAEDWIREGDWKEPLAGTTVFMEIGVDSETTPKSVFDRFTSELAQYGFIKTQIPVRLLQNAGERLVSRSQAKRLLARVDRFSEVVLDFAGVETIGQAFADEIFRVFERAQPKVHLTPINASKEVSEMIARARTAGGSPPRPDVG